MQTYQVSRISRETPAFWSHLPLTRRIIKISRISSIKLDQLILTKMVKNVATRCHILTLKCTKFDFGCRVANRPEFFGTVPNSAVSRVPNGSIRDRLMSRIFTAQTVMSTRILISGF